MDDDTIREAAGAHAKAVVDGDGEHVQGDFVPELHDRLPEIAKLLPQPVTEAQVLSVDHEGDEAEVVIQYTGEGSSARIRSRWAERDGQPRIIDGGPAEAA